MPKFDRCITADRSPRRGRLAFGLVLALALGGCGSLRLHSDVRQKQGEDAAKAWKEVDLKPLFAAERVHQVKLLEAEINGWNRHLADAYENEVRRLAKTSVGAYGARYDTLLKRLAGPADNTTRPVIANNVGDALSALRKERDAVRRLAREQSFLQSGRVPRFTCEQLTAAKPQIVDAWKARNPALAGSKLVIDGLKNAGAECVSIADAQDQYIFAVNKLDGGDIKARVTAWHEAQKALKVRQAEVDAAVVKVDEAQAEYDAELKKAEPGPSAVDKAKGLAAKIASAIDALETVQGVFGAEVASKERIKRLDDLLASLKSGEPLDSEEASKVEIAISMFPRIKDDLEAIKSTRRGRAAVPLLIQRDVEQARLDSAVVAAARVKQRVELLSIMVQASVQQADTVLTAGSHLRRVTAEGVRLAADSAAEAAAEQKAEDDALKNARTPAEEAAARRNRAKRDAALLDAQWSRLNPDDRRQLLESTVYYLDAFTRQEIPILAMETRELAISSERSVDLAEINASLWVSLIDATVTQASELSALGIKASDIEKLLNLIALGYIGHGANK